MLAKIKLLSKALLFLLVFIGFTLDRSSRDCEKWKIGTETLMFDNVTIGLGAILIRCEELELQRHRHS